MKKTNKKSTGQQEKSAKRAVAKSATEATVTSEPVDNVPVLVERKTRKRGLRRDGTMSGLDAAAKLLAEAGEPLNCKTLVERAIEKGLWKSGGKTPAATLYAAILREITLKGDSARFIKTERGMFGLRA